VAAACARFPSDSYEVLPGKAVIEVKPAGFNKGTGIRRLMACPPFRGRQPVFIGDDLTDESAFAVMPEFSGLGFSVGRTVSGLAGSFPSPGDVRDWLYRVSDLAGAHQP
jgi:trehalose 6-phosphate phosphatase